MNNKILFGIGGIVVGVIIASFFNPTGQFGGMMKGGNYSNSPVLSGVMMNNLDQHFIEQMIPHHDGAIAMAQLAINKAVHPEIKTLANAIIKAQNKEIIDMRSWYKLWFKKEVSDTNTGMMHGGMMSGGGMHMGGQEDVKNLENATDFDKAFIEAMIPHHQLAIMMAQMLKSGTNRPEMQTLSENIIESQSKEIKDMQSWYKSWYK